MKCLFAFLFCLLINASFAQGQKNFIDVNYIEVTGKAEIEIVPNEIYLKVILNEKDSKGKESMEDLERALLDRLKALGVDLEKQVAVLDMASNFKDYWIGKSDILKTKTYQIKVGTANEAGAIFKELEATGISNATIDRLEHSEIESYRSKVKVEAIKAAKVKAELLASSVDQEIGKALYIQELGEPNLLSGMMPGITSNIRIRGASSIYGSRAPEQLIEFGKLNLSYSILVRFQLN